jgi:hypothetical protein
MMIIKCKRCKRKILKYAKIGKGKLWHCWKDRIVENHSVHHNSEIRCPCGNLIGVEENKWIKIKPSSIICTGRRI